MASSIHRKDSGRCNHQCFHLNAHMECVFCKAHLCYACSENHIVDFRKQFDVQKCVIHQQEDGTHICIDCHMSLCFLCILSEQHKEHALVPIRNVSRKRFETFKQKLSECLNTFQEKEEFTWVRPFRRYSDTTDRMCLHDQHDLREIKSNVISWSEPISSKELNVLFDSFKVEFPDDPASESFVREILGKDSLKDLVIHITLLSNRIVVAKHCVLEVMVVNNDDHLEVILENNYQQDFFNLNEDDLTRVILIRSESIPIVEAKLVVYRTYKHFINKRKVVLRHVLEDIDEIAKLSAYDQLSSFCVLVETLIHTLTIDLQKSIREYKNELLTPEKIAQLCYEVFSRTEARGSVKVYRDWSRHAANFIYRQILVKGNTNPEQEVNIICQKTVKDLRVILSFLEEFQSNVLPEDQNKLFAEWCKREVLRDKTTLHPSILQFIAGRRSDGKPVVKVFLRDDDKEAEQYFRKCSKVSEDTEFEFVNVQKHSKVISREVEKIHFHEKKAYSCNELPIRNLGEIIQEQADKIFARFSNVVGIGISPVRCVDNTIKTEPCIVLYCLDKTIIPFGENPLPKSVKDWPCDLREDFVRFGACPNPCPSPSINFPEAGCSIGIPSVNSAGSVGFLVEPNNSMNNFEIECGFLTASHVAIARFQDLYRSGSLLTRNQLLALDNNSIVHPSWLDSGSDNEIGEVVESFCGNYGLNKNGIDVALVKMKKCRKEEKHILPVAKPHHLTLGGTMQVIKSGRTTGTTIGDLMHDTLTVRVIKDFLSREYFTFYNCYAVSNRNNIFFQEGDSGSGVYVIDNNGTLKPLGIAFAYMISGTGVCRIDEFVNSLGLSIVKYRTSQE